MTAACLVTLALTATAAEPDLTLYRQTQRQMGVDFTISAYAPDEATAKTAFAKAFARIEQLNAVLSDYDPTSELSRLSKTAPHAQPVEVSNDLFRVLRAAEQTSRLSAGAFDVTVGPLTRLWRRSRRRKQLPSAERLTEALAAVGWKKVRLSDDPPRARLTVGGMQLDAGGIAKGYAADEALAVLRKARLSRALVDGSGDLAIGDPPPGQPGWRIGAAPLGPDAPPSRWLALRNCGLATSGDAFQFVEIDGRRFSHIVDPRTGLGLETQLGVTVVAENGMQADALASAVSVLGPDRGIELVEKLSEVEALFVLGGNAASAVRTTTGFDKLPTATPPR